MYWSETGKVRDARPIASGTLELEAGKEGEFTHKPGKSGYYWFNLSKEGKRKTRRTKKIKVDCPEQPGEGGQPAEPPQNGGEDEQPGGTGTDDQVKPDDERSKGEDNSGEIPNHKSGQGGGKLPKTATSHPQSMWSAVCFSWRERGSWSSVGASPRPAPPSASRRGLLVGRPFLCWKIGILSRG